MKLTTLILIAAILHVSASTLAQRVTLTEKNAPLIDVFNQISNQTGYDFVFTGSDLKNAKPVTINVKNEELSDVLITIFKGQQLEFSIDNKSVVVKEKRAASVLDKVIAALKAIDVTGRIVDEKNQPIPGATVKLKDGSQITTTNSDGYFYFKAVNEKTTVIISVIGYTTKELASAKDLGTIVLTISESKLDEVKIVGYGTTTQRLTTGSIATISAKDIEKQPVTNVLSALSGQLPGVFIQTTNGLPGGNIKVQIRGKGSLVAGTNPLYIVDGVPIESDAPFIGDLAANKYIGGTISPLNNLNPADIESITVLKDADATSIYGSRGSNGVILITTKRNKSGDTKLDVNFRQGANFAAQKPRLLNDADYLKLRQEAFSNDGITPSSDPTSFYYAPDLTVWRNAKTTDWVNYVFGNTASTTDLQTAVSGGKENTTFSVNGNYHRESIILPGSNNYQRGGLYSQLQHRSANNKFTISLTNQITYQSNNISNIVNAYGGSYSLAPNFQLYLPDGSLNFDDTGTNIVAAQLARSTIQTNNTINNINLGYAITPALNFKINAGYTKTSVDQTLIFPARALPSYITNYTDFAKSSSESMIIEPQFDYTLKFKKSTLTLLTGGTWQSKNNQSQYIELSNFKFESLMEDFASAATVNIRQSNFAQYKYASVFGRINYNIEDTYLLNATIRRDGSSRFGPGNRFGNFGSVGAAWIFSNLNVLKNSLPFLSYGKIRGSFGTTGNDQIGDYQYLSTYTSPGSNLYQGTPTVVPSRINNANFHWENTQKLDVGLEAGFLKDRVFLSADYYINKSKDQLVNYSLSTITGFSSYQANLPAVVINKGWEFSANAKIITGDNFSWSGTFNFTLPKNELRSFENFENSIYFKAYELGYDITRLKGYKFLGIDKSTGNSQYAGQDGQVSATPYQLYTIGKLTPDYFGGFGNNFKYHNLEFSFFAQFVKQQLKGALSGSPGITIFNSFQIAATRWSPENPTGNFPKASTNDDPYLNNSSLNIFDASYLRLKNATVSYNLPASFSKRLKISKLRIYGESQNLLTLWHREGALIDPESGGSNIPPLKSLVLGLQLTL